MEENISFWGTMEEANAHLKGKRSGKASIGSNVAIYEGALNLAAQAGKVEEASIHVAQNGMTIGVPVDILAPYNRNISIVMGRIREYNERINGGHKRTM